MGNVIDKTKLANKIYLRLNKTINKRIIYNAVGIICDELKSELVNKRIINVHNFGTFTPYLFHARKGINIITKELQEHPRFWNITLHVHDGFAKLIKQSKEKFSK